MWFWLSIIALLFWSGSDLFSKIGCRGSDDKLSHLKMVIAVGVVMGLHACWEIFIGGVVLAIKVEAAKAVLSFFSSEYGSAFLDRMLSLGIDPRRGARAAVATEGPLVGAGCVLTGTLSRPRGEYAALIEKAGGIVQSAVTSKTKYLIAGANVGATKTEKARALGTEVIDEARLLELLGETSSDKAEQPVDEKPSTAAPVQGDLFG